MDLDRHVRQGGERPQHCLVMGRRERPLAHQRHDRAAMTRPDPPEMEVGQTVAADLEGPADRFGEMRIGIDVEQDGAGVANKGVGPVGDDQRPDDAHHRVEPDPPEQKAAGQLDDRQHRRRRVGEDMDIGRAQIVVVSVARMVVIVIIMIMMSVVIMGVVVMMPGDVMIAEQPGGAAQVILSTPGQFAIRSRMRSLRMRFLRMRFLLAPAKRHHSISPAIHSISPDRYVVTSSNTSRMTSAQRPSPNHGARARGPIDMLILHYTGMPSAAAALDRLCDAAAEVSAHYVIDEDGTVWQLVDEARRAWHAGRACWAGERDVNSRSIGIELVNPGHEYGYSPFPEPQIVALEELCHGILARHPIPPALVLGHSDVAPQRKQDPGEFFPWRRLAASGIGTWPDFSASDPAGAPPSTATARCALACIGYEVGKGKDGVADAATSAAIVAFQRRYRPELCDGVLDGETARRIATLAKIAALSP
jgi:N-acetylmuramoyl-L-alanine amidase